MSTTTRALPPQSLAAGSSLFLSRFPKGTASAADVEQFLSQTFPDAVSINVLRGPQEGSHKGQAYVHFRWADQAQQEVERLEASGGLRWSHPAAPRDGNAEGSGEQPDTSPALPPLIFLRVQSRSLVDSAGAGAVGAEALQKQSITETASNQRQTEFSPSAQENKRAEEDELARIRVHRRRVLEDISLWDGVPLPPQCVGYPYTRCAYHLARDTLATPTSSAQDDMHAGEEKREEEPRSKNAQHDTLEPIQKATVENTPTQTDIVPCNANQCLIAFQVSRRLVRSAPSHSLLEVLLYESELARETALKAFSSVLAPCGAPSLEMILRVPQDVTPERYHWLWTSLQSSPSNTEAQGFALQDQDPASPPGKALRVERETDSSSGLTPVTASEVFAMLHEFTEGRGRIAVKDPHGNIAVLQLPGYVSSL